MNKFYITTPIYYVNAKPHIGHTYTTVAADVLARYHRLIKDATFFSTGTDEHGAKIEEKAREVGEEPQAFVDRIAGQFEAAWQELNISHDRFIRTTEKDHISAVQNALQYMKQKGDIYLGKYEGLYCRGCEQFKGEKDLVEGKCPDHQTVPEKLSEESYMFRMSKYSEELLSKIESDELKIRPLERKNEIVSFYKNEGLKDVSFSRKNVKWGIKLPWRASHTAYVWSDAFLNYLTVFDWDGNGPSNNSNKLKIFWPPNLQLMSKDILRVHSTIWPAMLRSLDLPLMKEIFVHGFFLVDSQKMSKSLGNVISPEDLIKKYGVDATRYLLMSATTFGHDGDIGWSKFDEKYNADLANGLGNLVARVSNLLEKNNIETDVKPGKNQDTREQYDKAMKEYKLDEALAVIWQLIRKSDEELSAKSPWKMEDKKKIKNVMVPIAQNIIDISELLLPFLPNIAEKIRQQFNQKQIKKGDALFPRL